MSYYIIHIKFKPNFYINLLNITFHSFNLKILKVLVLSKNHLIFKLTFIGKYKKKKFLFFFYNL